MSIVIGPLEQLFVPVLQEFLHVRHELVGDSAIDNAMVVADAEMHHGADGNGFVSVLVGHNDGLFDDSTDAHDRDLRLIEDGHAEFGSEDAGVRDGEGSALNLFGLELLGAGALAEIGDGALQADEATLLGVLDHGDDQPPVKSNRDAQVDGRIVANVVAFDRRIDDGPLANAVHGSASEEWRKRQFCSSNLLEFSLHPLAQLHDARDVDFEDSVHMRAGAFRHHHVLGNLFAHHRHGHHFAGGHATYRLQRSRDCGSRRGLVSRSRGYGRSLGLCSRSGSSRNSASVLSDESLDVIFGNTAAKSGPRNLAEVYVVFLGNLAYQRAGTDTSRLAGFGLGLGFYLRSGTSLELLC